MKFFLKFLGVIVIFSLMALYLTGPYMEKDSQKQIPLNTTSECLHGREATYLMGGVMDTMNSPPKPGCPGYENYREGKIGTYKLGLYTFRIPRDYLIQGKYDEGEVEGLYLFIDRVSMGPVTETQRKIGGWGNKLKITLNFNTPCENGVCRDPSLIWYDVKIGLNTGNPYRVSTINAPVYDEAVGLMHYRITQNKTNPSAVPDYYDVFFAGSARKPDRWFFCQPSMPSPSCETKYQLEDGLWVKLIFSQKLVAQHEEITALVNEKLHTFIVK